MAHDAVEYCVVGAGFAGLTTAHRLQRAGHSVALLERATGSVVADPQLYVHTVVAWAKTLG